MKKVIVAPLNWGLGHATRCIPLINYLHEQGFTPVLASDGAALDLLAKEFPSLETLVLPSYSIRYGKRLKTSLFRQIPRILRASKKERAIIDRYISENSDVIGLISDNRFGVRSNRVTSVYLSHQLKVLSGPTTLLTSWVHRRYVRKFDECWVPDTPESRFSGTLSQYRSIGIPLKYLGILSRFNPEELPIKNDLLIILSGPEPNRSQLEASLFDLLQRFEGKVCIVRGTTKPLGWKKVQANIEVHDLMISKDLEREINQSELIISRSGYSSVMDMAALGKRAFFIPTKGQYEQEYLASYLQEQNWAQFATEATFSLSHLKKLNPSVRFEVTESVLTISLLDLFERK